MDTTVTGDFNVWRSLISLVLIFGAMWSCMRWIRRRRRGGPSRRMKVVERLPIDARRTIMLVQVDGLEFMLGVTAEQITLLNTLKPQERNEA